MNESKINHSINIILHVLILFTFLSIFFFVYISKVEKKTIKQELDHLIHNQTDKILTNIDNKLLSVPQLPKPLIIIDWNVADNIADVMIKDSEKRTDKIEKHNDNLLRISIGIISGLFILLIGTILFFKYYKGYNINLKEILLENLIIFTFIGIIEFGFFMFIALKYVPVTPDVAVVSMIDRLKYLINKKMLN